MTIRKNGGIWFIRVGRIGGSFYIAKRKAIRISETAIALHAGKYEIVATVMLIAALTLAA